MSGQLVSDPKSRGRGPSPEAAPRVVNDQDRVWNLPNAITIARLLLSLVIFALMQWSEAWIVTAILFVVAVLTDVLDGWIARRWNLITTFGRVMDPFVDKFITGGVFVFLAARSSDALSPWVVVIVLGREMLVTSLRGILEQRGLDFSASASGKLKMFLQCVAATGAMVVLDPLVQQSPYAQMLERSRDGLVLLMTLVTLWSGWIYIQRAIVLFRQDSATAASSATAPGSGAAAGGARVAEAVDRGTA